MKVNALFQFVFPIVLCSCNRQPQLVAGHYVVKEPSFFEWRKFYKTGAKASIAGSELFLNTDSTFKYITCGNEMTGKWSANRGQVFLYVQHNRFRIDSLNTTSKISSPTIPLVYTIDDEELYTIMNFTSGKAVELLMKK